MLSSTFLSVITLLLPLSVGAPTPASPRLVQERGVDVGWPYGSQKIRGVNIGGVSLSSCHIVVLR